MTDPFHTEPPPLHYVGCPEDEREQAMAAMTMLVFVAKCILIVVTLIGLGLAVMWGGV